MEVNWLQIATLVIAVAGAVLGVLNTWRTFSQDRVRIRISARYTHFTDGKERLAITVVNLSAFAITVTHVGFTMRGTDRHMQLLPEFLHPEGTLPIRLEPRTAFTAFAAPRATEVPGFTRVGRPYVNTACGLRLLGSRKELLVALHNLALAGK